MKKTRQEAWAEFLTWWKPRWGAAPALIKIPGDGMWSLIRGIYRGIRFLAQGFWMILGLLASYQGMTLSFFYVTAALMLVHLWHTNDGAFGLTIIAQNTFPFQIPWWWVPSGFAVCGVFSAREQSAPVYAVLSIPLFGYAGAIGYGAFTGSMTPLVYLSVLYLLLAGINQLVIIRVRFDVDVERAQRQAVEAEMVKSLAEVRGLGRERERTAS